MLSPLLCWTCDTPTTGAPGLHAYCPKCNDHKRTYTTDLGKDGRSPVLAVAPAQRQRAIGSLFDLPGTCERISLKKRRTMPKGVVYVGRQSERLHQHESPLANPYKIDRDGTRSEVCEQYRAKVLYPALDAKNGAVWNEISNLADRVLMGESVKVGCPGCDDRQECHASDIAAAVVEVARSRYKNQEVRRDARS